MLFKKTLLKTSQYWKENTCVGVSRPAILLKRDSITCGFLWLLRKFKEKFFLWNTSGGCFCIVRLTPSSQQLPIITKKILGPTFTHTTFQCLKICAEGFDMYHGAFYANSSQLKTLTISLKKFHRRFRGTHKIFGTL